MPTNLTGNTIASTFNQLLHVDDGPTATEKTVYSGTAWSSPALAAGEYFSGKTAANTSVVYVTPGEGL